MISGISSSISSYTSSASATSGTGGKKFQEELLARLDTDGDGAISKDELNTALSSDSKDGITVSLSQAFTDLDSDDDDSLDAEELAAVAPPPPPPMQPASDLAEQLLGSLDTDGDGAISSDELATGLTNAGSSADGGQVFDALDTNEDGTVSLEELTASLQPQQPPVGPPPAQTASTDSAENATLFSALDTDSDDSISAQALSRMVAALGERYNTDGSKPVGKYLDTAA